MKLHFVDPPGLNPGETLIPSFDMEPAIPSALSVESWNIFKNSCITNFYYIWIMEQIGYGYQIVVKTPGFETKWNLENIGHCHRTWEGEPFIISKSDLTDYQQIEMLDNTTGCYVKLQLDHPDFEIWAELAPIESVT